MWTDGRRRDDVRRTDDDERQVITIAHPEPCSGELKIRISSARILFSVLKVKVNTDCVKCELQLDSRFNTINVLLLIFHMRSMEAISAVTFLQSDTTSVNTGEYEISYYLCIETNMPEKYCRSTSDAAERRTRRLIKVFTIRMRCPLRKHGYSNV